MTTTPSDTTGSTPTLPPEEQDAAQFHAMTAWFYTPNLILVILNLLLAMVIIPMNLTVFAYFRRAGQNIVHFTYCLLSACDIVIGVSALVHSVTFILLVTETVTVLPYVLAGEFVITEIVIRVSVFINVTLAVLRTINITLPFYDVKLWPVRLSVAIYTFIWTLIVVLQLKHEWEASTNLNFYRTLTFHYIPIVGVNLLTHLLPSDTAWEFYNSICYGLPFLLPSIICLICLIVQLYSLFNNQFINSKNQFHAGITVFLISVLFFVANSSSTILGMVGIEGNENAIILMYVFRAVFPFITSALNPIILITRGSYLRAFILGKVSFRGSVSKVRDKMRSLSRGSIKEGVVIRNESDFCNRDSVVNTTGIRIQITEYGNTEL